MTRLTDQQRRDRELSEAELRSQVEDLAAMLGYESMFVMPLRASGGIWKTATFGSLGKGWPDTTFIHRRTGRTIYVEFKRELGKTTPDQDRVHSIMRVAGLEVYIIRPSDFDWIVEVLRS